MESKSLHNLNQNASTTDKGPIDQGERKQAFKLYMTDLMELLSRGVNMGFLVKRGDNYHWNLDADWMLTQEADV